MRRKKVARFAGRPMKNIPATFSSIPPTRLLTHQLACSLCCWMVSGIAELMLQLPVAASSNASDQLQRRWQLLLSLSVDGLECDAAQKSPSAAKTFPLLSGLSKVPKFEANEIERERVSSSPHSLVCGDSSNCCYHATN